MDNPQFFIQFQRVMNPAINKTDTAECAIQVDKIDSVTVISSDGDLMGIQIPGAYGLTVITTSGGMAYLTNEPFEEIMSKWQRALRSLLGYGFPDDDDFDDYEEEEEEPEDDGGGSPMSLLESSYGIQNGPLEPVIAIGGDLGTIRH